MKITLSADENLIEAVRKRARAGHTILNEQFRRWLELYAQTSVQKLPECFGADLSR